jgi:DNA polymerase III subunit alpha
MTSSTAYAPLHTHTQFSLLEASSRTADLVKIAAANNMPALAITDSGNLYGAVEFYGACKNAGIKPIIGCELGVVEGEHTDRNTRKPTQNIVLLCQNLQGYQNLIKLVSEAHLKGFYYKPRINWELLKQHSEGLIALTDCVAGPIGYNVLRGHMELARDKVRWLKDVFGDNLYIELQDHGQGPEMQVTAEAIKIAKELGCQWVITNNSRFSYAGQEKVLDILLCMQAGKTIHDTSRNKPFGAEFYLKTGDELLERFNHLERRDVEKGLANTLLVADKIDFKWPMGESLLPAYPLPEGQTEAGYLKEVVYEFAAKKFPSPLPQDVVDRLELELGVINAMGFPAYFLIVWDFINYARTQEIPVGPGRGSAAGSLVAYVLGITNIDPLKHNLLFERFLNPERISMPDIDIDFCIERRGDVIAYVGKRYGQERVCQIATFGTLAAKAAVKAVARVLDIPYADSDRISKMIPSVPGTKLKDALAEGTELAGAYENELHVKDWIDLALALEGTACNVGTHAAGVVISKDPLNEVIALQNSKDGQVISQFTMGDLEKLGLLKMDFLGLRNLTIINNTLTMVGRTQTALPDMDDLPLDDPKVYELLSAGDTDGVFQLESSGMKALVRDLRPNVFEDINALVALYRPGPLNSGMVKTFVDRKHGREEVSFPHPSLEPILSPTYGTIVYQEQIMQIAQILAGYSLGQADLLRRAMGKKKAEVMEKEREGFLAGCEKNSVDLEMANGLFDIMTEFAAYCFNRSHSAAYAYVAFQTAYLKAHHPVEYLSALLSSVRDNLDKIRHYIVAARRMKLAILPPDVQRSNVDFTPDEQAIIFGLASIKNVGVGVVESIMAARQKTPFASLEDFLKRVPHKVLNRKTLESLIQCGALSCFGHGRKHLFNNVEALVRYAEDQAAAEETGQVSLFSLLSTTGVADLMLTGDPTEEYSNPEIQAMEKQLMGFYISSHPLDGLQERLPLLVSHTLDQLSGELSDVEDGTEVIVGGLVDAVQRRMSRKNTAFLMGLLEDFNGQSEFMVFGETVAIMENQLEAGQTYLMRAKVSVRGDDEESTQVSLIAQQIYPLEALLPVLLQFDAPPSYEALIYLAKSLAELQNNEGRAEKKNKFSQFRKEPNIQREVRLPIVIGLGDGSRWKLPTRYWLPPSALPVWLQKLKQLGETEILC